MQHKGLGGMLKGALRILYPPQCLSCSGAVAGEAGLCSPCWTQAQFITGHSCGRCGAPLPADGEADSHRPADAQMVCDECLKIARPWRHGRAALVYAGTGRQLVLALKHADRPDLAPTLGDWLARAAAPLIRPGMIVIPVPVHPWRLLKRKYNQAELLSAHLARTFDLSHCPEILHRTRHSEGQDHKGVSDRFANVAGSIAVSRRQASRLEGCSVLLVDDVMTSGATLAQAADALRAGGSGPISVAVVARAVKEH
ncbi:amidophosphoribosyltransferase [Paracoccus tegillarcae]|uniref:Amidophosphoribosyltransferase n=2 Tax=Paracoccus tegillarcae TaxID=1529068 RepID=A0A2K9EJY9_9RHOB|nr:amidophosphoribosyltransferase [Paracoccus tegillarcae]